MNKVFAAILGAGFTAIGARFISILGTSFLATLSTQVLAQKHYAPGVSDTEIKIG